MAPGDGLPTTPAIAATSHTESDPLNETVLSYLFSVKYESPDVDFKETIETARGSSFAKVARHFFGMSNYGGGFLLVGFRPKPTGGFLPVGLPPDFHIDQAELQGKFNSMSSVPLAIGYREVEREVEREVRRFAVVYIPPGSEVVVPSKDGQYSTAKGKEKVAFSRGDVLIRRGTSTIRATPAEIQWIRRRASDTAYQISLLTGDPDYVQETLSSNIFQALILPPRVFGCVVRLRGRPVPVHGLQSCLVAGRDLFSFEDPSLSPLTSVILRGSETAEPLSMWESDSNKSRQLMELFDSALVLKAARLGMEFDWARRRLFYPLSANQQRREERWAGISKPDSRQVAIRRYLSSLKQEVVIHSSVRCDFIWIEDLLHLRLEPGFLLSEDGFHPLYGQKQGSVLIGLESWLSSHNAGYLRNVLFWSSKLQDEDKVIRLAPSLEFSGNPTEARIEVGIREDTLRSVERHRGEPEIPPTEAPNGV